MNKKSRKRDRIYESFIEYPFGVEKGRGNQYNFEHHINKVGRITETILENKFDKNYIRMEDGFIYKKIEYRYDGDFMIESDYISDGIIDENYEPIMRLFFEYEK